MYCILWRERERERGVREARERERGVREERERERGRCKRERRM